MRGHGHIDYENREPYLQSDDVQDIIRESIKLRYELIHYLYTTFYQASIHGTPVVRPMWFEYPKDSITFDITEQFMIGDSFLIAPKLQAVEIDPPYCDLQESRLLTELKKTNQIVADIEKNIYPIKVYFPKYDSLGE